jgi:hypothetical protein
VEHVSDEKPIGSFQDIFHIHPKPTPSRSIALATSFLSLAVQLHYIATKDYVQARQDDRLLSKDGIAPFCHGAPTA